MNDPIRNGCEPKPEVEVTFVLQRHAMYYVSAIPIQGGCIIVKNSLS